MDGAQYHLRADKILLDVMQQVTNTFKIQQHVNGQGFFQFKPHENLVFFIEPILGLHNFHYEVSKLLHVSQTSVPDLVTQRLHQWFSWSPGVLKTHCLSFVHRPTEEFLYCDDILFRTEDDPLWAEDRSWTLNVSDWFALKTEEKHQVQTWLQKHAKRVSVWFEPGIVFGQSLICPVEKTGFLWVPTGSSTSLGLWPLLYWVICLALDHRKQLSEYRQCVLKNRSRDLRKQHGMDLTWVNSPRWILCLDGLPPIDLRSHESLWHPVFPIPANSAPSLTVASETEEKNPV